MTQLPDCFCHGMVKGCRVCGGTGTEPCPVCHGTGKRQELIPGSDHTYRVIDCLACIDQDKVRQPQVIGLGPAMQNNLLIEMTGSFLSTVKDKIEQVLKSRQGWIVLCGPSSKGKTYALAAALNAMHDFGLRTGRYVQAGMLISELHAAAIGEHDRGLTLNALQTEIINLDLLCIDELNWISNAIEDWKQYRFRDILIGRSEAMGYMPTIFATNKPIKWFQQYMPWLVARFDRGPVYEFDFNKAQTQKSRLQL